MDVKPRELIKGITATAALSVAAPRVVFANPIQDAVVQLRQSSASLIGHKPIVALVNQDWAESTFAKGIAAAKPAKLQLVTGIIYDELREHLTQKTHHLIGMIDYGNAAVLTPTKAEQIQEIIRICNEFKIPIWTISTGNNFGYGTAAPHHAGQVILDLKKMNKIIHVDPDLCTALLEPGVTYQQLVDYLKEKGYKLWVDPPAPSAIVGPVGNTLDRGVGYTPYAEHFLFQCGMEVVLANGKVLRTGMGGNMTMTEFGLYNWRGGSMWFAPVSQAKESETLNQVKLVTRILNKYGFDYVGEFIVTQRCMHHIVDVLFDRTDPEEMQRAHDCFAELLDEFEKAGYGVYRVNNVYMDRVARSFSKVQQEINHTLKRARSEQYFCARKIGYRFKQTPSISLRA